MRAVAAPWKTQLASLTHPVLLRLTQAVFLSSRSSKTHCQEEQRSKVSSKTYVRFAVREKKSDSKSVVNNLLFNGRSLKGDSERTQRQRKLKARHSNSTKEKRWREKRKGLDEKGSFTWAWGGESFTFGNSNSNSNSSSCPNGFEWRDDSNWDQNRNSKFWNESDVEEEGEELRSEELMLHRAALELPPAGALNIHLVKSAFRLAALKWHPDKHQGASKGVAEEKFKRCVDAYTALSRSLMKP